MCDARHYAAWSDMQNKWDIRIDKQVGLHEKKIKY